MTNGFVSGDKLLTGDKWRRMKVICLLMSPFVSCLSPFVSRSRETNDFTGDKWRQKVEKMDACFVSTTTLHNFERLVFSKMVLLSPSNVLRKGLALLNLNSNTVFAAEHALSSYALAGSL